MTIKLLNLYTREFAEVDIATVQKEVGVGWGCIIERLITDLLALGWNGEINQVKEKFGGLRFYVGETTDEMRKLISAAENLSYETCEVCGGPGEQTSTGWIKTLCAPCVVKWETRCSWCRTPGAAAGKASFMCDACEAERDAKRAAKLTKTI